MDQLQTPVATEQVTPTPTLRILIPAIILSLIAGGVAGYFYAESKTPEVPVENESKMIIGEWRAVQEDPLWSGLIKLVNQKTGEEKHLFTVDELLSKLPSDTFSHFGRESFGANVMGGEDEIIYISIGPGIGPGRPPLYSYNINEDSIEKLSTMPRWRSMVSPSGTKEIIWDVDQFQYMGTALYLGCYKTDSIKKVASLELGQEGFDEVLSALLPELADGADIQWIDDSTVSYKVFSLPDAVRERLINSPNDESLLGVQFEEIETRTVTGLTCE